MRGAIAMAVLAILAHDVSCYRVNARVSELGAIGINHTFDHMKAVMLHEEPGTQNSWAGVYRNVSGPDPGGDIIIEQPGAMGGLDNVSLYRSENPGFRVNATVDGDTIKYHQKVQPAEQGLEITRANGVVSTSDGSTWERDGAGMQNSWTGVYHNVTGSRGIAIVLQPGVMGGPNNASIYLSESPSKRLNATVDGDKMTLYQKVEVLAPPIKGTRSHGVIESPDGPYGSTLAKKEETMAPKAEVGRHNGHDEHIQAYLDGQTGATGAISEDTNAEAQALMGDLEGNQNARDAVDE